ncbi:hypothetical protein CEF00_13040, partial [Lactobacillus crispatus]
LEPHEIAKTKLGHPTLPKALDIFVIALYESAPTCFVASDDQVANADASNVTVQGNAVANFEQLFCLSGGEAKVAQRETRLSVLLAKFEVFALLWTERDNLFRLLDSVEQKCQLPLTEEIFSHLPHREKA